MDPCRLCERAFRNTDGFPRNSTPDKKDRLISDLRERLNSLLAQVNDTRDNGFNVNHLIEFQASRLTCHFSFCYIVDGVPHRGVKKLPPLPAHDDPIFTLISNETATVVKCNLHIVFSALVNRGDKTGTIRDSVRGHLSCCSFAEDTSC